jgi:hypothetical protein
MLADRMPVQRAAVSVHIVACRKRWALSRFHTQSGSGVHVRYEFALELDDQVFEEQLLFFQTPHP